MIRLFTFGLITIFIIVISKLVIQRTYKYITLNKKINNTESKTRLSIRLVSTIPYYLPLFEGLQNFGQYVLPDYPVAAIPLYKKIILPMLIFYMNHAVLGLVTFFALYYVLVRNKSPIPVHQLVRFNSMQSILLFLVGSLFGAVFRAFPIEFRISFIGLMVCNMMFWFVLSTITYSIVKAMQGKYSNIPVISEAVRIQISGYST
uniref:Tic20 family protein Ycf60 n=1 Tax=Pyropia dentata TaxID=76160 RepID=UPI00286CC9AF|nr:Tic20 family protein Ycf60 [Neoporphyra dentata]WKD83910.1 Tic20 family protein Ycf60 [Neoporphyra dentata]